MKAESWKDAVISLEQREAFRTKAHMAVSDYLGIDIPDIKMSDMDARAIQICKDIALEELEAQAELAFNMGKKVGAEESITMAQGEAIARGAIVRGAIARGEAIAAADKVLDEAIAAADKAWDETTAAADKVLDEAIAAADKAWDKPIAAAYTTWNEAADKADKAWDEAIAAANTTWNEAADKADKVWGEFVTLIKKWEEGNNATLD